MLPQLTPLAETRAIQDIVAATEAKIRREAEQEARKLRQEAEEARLEAQATRVETARNLLALIDDDKVIAKTIGLALAKVQQLRTEQG